LGIFSADLSLKAGRVADDLKNLVTFLASQSLLLEIETRHFAFIFPKTMVAPTSSVTL
jgi:hypothetical protein